jgi:hypothetical protein
MRVTIDLDTPAVTDIIESWDLLTRYGDRIVWGRVSSSGLGVHLEVHGVDESIGHQLRVAAGDDRKRIWYDALTSLKPKQILFDRKKGREAQRWTTSYQDVIDRYRQTAPAALVRRYNKLCYPVCRRYL